MNDQFWQSLPREVDITPQDWSRFFDFWNELPQQKPEPKRGWTLGMAARFTAVAVYLVGIAWLIWHFV